MLQWMSWRQPCASVGGVLPTYTLGNLNAAQLFQKALSQKSIKQSLDRHDHAPLLSWLRQNVHAKGATLTPSKLMESATGRATDPAPYLNHLRKRFAP